MKTTKLAIALAVTFVMIAGPTILAQEEAEPTKIKGEVVQLMKQTRTQNGGEFDSLMIRTRAGKQRRLLLGEAGSGQEQFQVGDQVQARLSSGGQTGDGYQVRSMKVRQTGQSYQYRDASGDMLQTQTRTRGQNGDGAGAGTGTQSRTRDRTQQPGSGCSGAGGGGSRRGGGSGGGGGGRR